MTSVLIVGAGPAGIRAAQSLVKAGLRPRVIDEGAQSGGQIYRRPPKGFLRRAKTLYGSEAGKALALHETFDRMLANDEIDYVPNASVLGVHDGVAQCSTPVGECYFEYDRLILATGAMDRVLPIEGWQRPGVFTLGAAQIALKAQGVALGKQIVLCGSGPLLTLLASQLRAAGAGVVAVLDTASLSGQLGQAPEMLRRRPIVTIKGLVLRANLLKLYRYGVKPLRFEGSDHGLGKLVWQDHRGREQSTACDTILMGWHLQAETALAELAGARFVWDGTCQQFLPLADRFGRAGAGLYLAGDGVWLAGADGAEVGGQLAAAACLKDLGLRAADTRALLRKKKKYQRFAQALMQAFPWPSGLASAVSEQTVLCRCEGITRAEFVAGLARGDSEANRTKALSRLGMGRCQGRYCRLAAAEIAAKETGGSAQDFGRLRGQPPVRPVPVSGLVEWQKMGETEQ